MKGRRGGGGCFCVGVSVGRASARQKSLSSDRRHDSQRSGEERGRGAGRGGEAAEEEINGRGRDEEESVRREREGGRHDGAEMPVRTKRTENGGRGGGRG